MKPSLLLSGAIAVSALAVAALAVSGRLPPLGRLPGDLRVEGRHGVIVVPLTSCLLISAAATAAINLVMRLFRGGP